MLFQWLSVQNFSVPHWMDVYYVYIYKKKERKKETLDDGLLRT